MIALIAVGAVTLGAIGLGAYGVRLARTTSDLFVASRAVSPWWNAAAISGEYLSTASFLGIAGLQMKLGSSALWLPIGFTAGYVALLLFVAAPLRRFGSYTIPDFAEARFASAGMRYLAAVIVLVIGGFYLVPQLKGAGLTLREVTGAPYAIGVLVVGLIVALNVALGGMRGITYVQAFQYWVKMFAIALPACVLVIHFGGLPGKAALFGQEFPRAPDGGVQVALDEPRRVVFPAAATVAVDGVPISGAAEQEVTLPAGLVTVPGGAVVPVASDIEPERGEDWARPVSDAGGQTSPLFVYSLLIATFLGTMGLPHILVRFYTNPDGPAARGTTVRVLGLLGLFYMFPAIYGALGRVLVPQLYITGQTDLAVLRVPEAAIGGVGGEVLGAIVAAGAFAAFMSTASGLLVSVAGTVAHDVWGRRAGAPRVSGAVRMRRFRVAALLGALAPIALAFPARAVDISVLVGWAFAIAASTFCPLFLLGIWWSRLTARAAAAGMIVGASVASAIIFTGLIADPADDTVSALLTQPAALSVPIAFATMIGISLAGGRRDRPREDPMLALHAPEGLGLSHVEDDRLRA